MNKNVKKKRKGFTLIELIIVLAIMAIIAAIAIPNFTSVRNNSRDKADVQSAETIKRTVLMLVSDSTITAGTKTFDVSFSGSTMTVTAGDTSYDADKSSIASALKDIKAPQGEVFTGYSTSTSKPVFTSGTTAAKFHIVIDSTGNVTVTTTA